MNKFERAILSPIERILQDQNRLIHNWDKVDRVLQCPEVSSDNRKMHLRKKFRVGQDVKVYSGVCICFEDQTHRVTGFARDSTFLDDDFGAFGYRSNIPCYCLNRTTY